MADDATLASIRELERILELIQDHFAETDLRTVRAGESLECIFLEMKAICRLMESFKGNVGNLRMLKTLTNIQSAGNSRHGAGFRTVAANIGTLALDVQSRSAAIIVKVKQLRSDLEQAMETASELREIQKRLASRMVADIRFQIANLAGMNNKCSAAAEQVSGRSDRIFRDVQEMVVALQFQDITRQQMEHAHESLVAMRSALSGSFLSCAEASGIAALQKAQLVHSSDELQAAVAAVSTRLNTVARESAVTTAQAHGLFRMAGTEEHAALGEIEKGFSSIITAFFENLETNRKLSGIMRRVAVDLEEISSIAHDIDYFGSEIRLIAFNAIIMAAQAGKDGAAFSVIAATVKQQSEDICRQAAAITGAIGEIVGHVANLRTELVGGEESAEPDETGRYGEVLTAAVGRLTKVTDMVTSHLTRADEFSEKLAAVIGEALAALDSREIDTILRGEVIPRLERLAEAFSLGSEQDAGSGSPGIGIERITERYTMQSEREIHRMFAVSPRFGQAEVVKTTLSADASLTVGSDFGDNVEFF
jgi:methyl-accepting chemotaxis protein